MLDYIVFILTWAFTIFQIVPAIKGIKLYLLLFGVFSR